MNKSRSFTVDSHQARNTNEIIDALKDYCMEKSGCNDPAPYTEKQQKADWRVIENMESNIDRNTQMLQRVARQTFLIRFRHIFLKFQSSAGEIYLH